MFVAVGRWRGITIDSITRGTPGTVKLVRKVAGVYESYKDVDSADLTIEADSYLSNSGDTIAADTAVFVEFFPDGTWEVVNAHCEVRDWTLDDE